MFWATHTCAFSESHSPVRSFNHSFARCRTLCGIEVDAELQERKGLIMQNICKRRKQGGPLACKPSGEAAWRSPSTGSMTNLDSNATQHRGLSASTRQLSSRAEEAAVTARTPSAIPADPTRGGLKQTLEMARVDLYSDACLSEFATASEPAPLTFLSHSFGKIPPSVHARALRSLFQLYSRPGESTAALSN